MLIYVGDHFLLQGKVAVICDRILGKDIPALTKQGAPQRIEGACDIQFEGSFLSGFQGEHTDDGFPDTFVIGRIRGIVQVFDPVIIREGGYIIFKNCRAAAKDSRMKTDTDEPASLTEVGMPVMKLTGIDDKAVLSGQEDRLPVDIIIHHSFYDTDQFDIFMPVAQGFPAGIF